MNMLSLHGMMPSVREIPGFAGFSNLKRDGVLRTGLEARVHNQVEVQDAVNKLAEVQFPSQFASCNGNRWIHPDGRVIVEKRDDDYRIRYYDTDSGFEADSRVSV